MHKKCSLSSWCRRKCLLWRLLSGKKSALFSAIGAAKPACPHGPSWNQSALPFLCQTLTWAWLGIRAADGLCEYQGKGMLEKQCEDTELEKKKRGCCVSKVMCLNSTVWKARIAKVMATLAWVSGMWNCHLSNLYYTWSLSNQCYQSHLPTQTPAVWQLGKKWALKCSLKEFPCTWHRWELSYI